MSTWGTWSAISLCWMLSVVSGCRRNTNSVYSNPFYMTNLCSGGQTQVSLDVRTVVRLMPHWTYYRPDTQCTVILRRGSGSGNMYVNFLRIDIPSSFSGCTYGYVQAFRYYPDGHMSALTGPLCGYRKYQVASTSDIAIRFETTSYSALRTGFDLTANPYNQTGNCTGFRCGNGRCIDQSLRCDYYDNCGDSSDESVFTCNCGTNCIVGICVALAVSVVIACILFFVCKEPARRQRVLSLRNSEPVQVAVTQPDAPPTYAEAMSTAPGTYTPHTHVNPTYAK